MDEHAPKKPWKVDRERLETDVIRAFREATGTGLWRGHARIIVDTVLRDLRNGRKLQDAEDL